MRLATDVLALSGEQPTVPMDSYVLTSSIAEPGTYSKMIAGVGLADESSASAHYLG